MIEQILPGGVSSAALRDFAAAEPLLPAEAKALGRVCRARAAEFTAGRHCAQAALASLGMPSAPLLRAADGAPHWPAGTVGAITHCRGYCAAAAAPTTAFASIGIDAEPDLPLPHRVTDHITLPAERYWLATAERCWLATGERPANLDRLLFSAKESVYKAWAPLTNGAWLGFTDATVTVDLDAGVFDATLHVPPPLVDGVPQPHFTGRFLMLPDLILTSVVIPRSTPRAPRTRPPITATPTPSTRTRTRTRTRTTLSMIM
ncbi:MAG TPA: 4'-phosphopantetheinyl transferase superfamily protein [Streptosporangiaceae bacterium]|nr:4'-phosphopantetheinyl transferase superfamily protein [Streptosporangiaceae bacterium]